MSFTEKQLELLSFELNSLKEQHKYAMLSLNSKPFEEKFNPNQPFKNNFFEKYNELSKEELLIYLKNLNNNLFEILGKMNIHKLDSEEKMKIYSLVSKYVDPQYYSSSFLGFAGIVKGKYASYGVEFNTEELSSFDRKFSYFKALNEVFCNNKIRRFLEKTANRLAIMEHQFSKKTTKKVYGVRQILLKKLDSFLNSPLEKKMAYSSFVGGIGLITVPYIGKYINLKLITRDMEVSLNNGEGTGVLGLTVGLLLLVLSLYLWKKIPK